MTESRLIELETRIAYLDDTLQDLNTTVYEQDLRIAKLEMINKRLLDRVKELADLAYNAKVIDEKPPHY